MLRVWDFGVEGLGVYLGFRGLGFRVWDLGLSMHFEVRVQTSIKHKSRAYLS